MDGVDQKEQDEFEIQFYESLMARKPDFVEALSALGDLYTKAGRFKDGLKIDERLSLLRPEDPIVLYNLSCSYSLLSEVDKALRSIKKAINCGYHDFSHIEADGDLENLRADSRFQKYFQRIKNNLTA